MDGLQRIARVAVATIILIILAVSLVDMVALAAWNYFEIMARGLNFWGVVGVIPGTLLVALIFVYGGYRFSEDMWSRD